MARILITNDDGIDAPGIAALALRALGRVKQATERRIEAEAGFRRLGAATLLERLQRQWGA